jgi:hypothetical protein
MLQYLDLPPELLFLTWKFIDTNSDMLSIKSTCQKFCQMLEGETFIKNIYITLTSDFRYVPLLLGSYRRTETVIFKDIDNLTMWWPDIWFKKMIVKNCDILQVEFKIEPNRNSVTEELIFFPSSKTYIDINFKNLQALQKLYIRCKDINLNSIRYCINLENIYLEVTDYIYHQEKKPLPEFFADFLKLRSLVTNCEAKKSLNFVSPFLKELVFYKKIKCTAVSPFIKVHQLSDKMHWNMHWNISSIVKDLDFY